MKAIVQNSYGSSTVLELKEIDRPVVKENGVLVRVHAAWALGRLGDVDGLRARAAIERDPAVRRFLERRRGELRPGH